MFLLLIFAIFVRSAAQNCETDILFILDGSGSVIDDFDRNKELLKQISNLIKVQPGGQRVALIEYSGLSRRWPEYAFGELNTNEKFQTVIDKLKNIQGTTATGEALRRARELLKDRRQETTTLVVILTDGFSYDHIIEHSEAIQGLPNVFTFAGGVSKFLNFPELDILAGTRERVFHGDDVTAQALRILDPILSCAIKQPTPRPGVTKGESGPTASVIDKGTGTESPEDTDKETESPEDTDKEAAATQGPELTTKEKDGTTAPDEGLQTVPEAGATTPRGRTTPKEVVTASIPPEVPTTAGPIIANQGCELDLVFILDLSSSVSQLWRDFVQMAVRLVEALQIGSRGTRVGLVRYSSSYRVKSIFHLNTFKTKEGVVQRVKALKKITGLTATATALKLAKEEFLPEFGGDRQGVKKVAVLYSDGYSYEDPAAAAEELRNQGIEVYAITVETKNLRPNKNELLDIAGSASRVFSDTNYGEFMEIMKQYNQLC